MRKSLLLFMIVFSILAEAQDVLTVRNSLSFRDSLNKLQSVILDNEYKISIVQRCDFGLNEAGYSYLKYRVVFFGKFDEVQALSDAYPEISPFLPLRIVVAEDAEGSTLSSLNPEVFLETVKDRELTKIINRWSQDIGGILNKMNGQ